MENDSWCDCAAGYSSTGTLTRPKLIVPFQIALAISLSLSRGAHAHLLQHRVRQFLPYARQTLPRVALALLQQRSHVCNVEVIEPHVAGEVLPVDRHRDRRARFRAHRVRRNRGCPFRVAQVVDEDAPLAASQARVGASGTTTCRPLPPVVLRKHSSSSVSSNLRSTVTASTSLSHASPSSGSKSKISRSGWPSSGAREPHGWSSSTPICSNATTALVLFAIMYGFTPPLSRMSMRSMCSEIESFACF